METKRKVIVLFSGGKDSEVAILETLKRYPKEDIRLVFEDTGAEYLETLPQVQKIANILELPLVVIRAELDFWQRVKKTGYFPRPQYRFCTSRLKERVFRNWLRQNQGSLGNEIIVVSGIRAEESRSRQKMEPWRYLDQLSLNRSGFDVWGWLPCFNMSEREIYERIKAEKLPLHPCYEFSKRCSCWCCIFASKCEVRAYAEAHPELYEQACLVEDEIKDKWKYGFGFNDLMKQMKLF